MLISTMRFLPLLLVLLPTVSSNVARRRTQFSLETNEDGTWNSPIMNWFYQLLRGDSPDGPTFGGGGGGEETPDVTIPTGPINVQYDDRGCPMTGIAVSCLFQENREVLCVNNNPNGGAAFCSYGSPCLAQGAGIPPSTCSCQCDAATEPGCDCFATAVAPIAPITPAPVPAPTRRPTKAPTPAPTLRPPQFDSDGCPIATGPCISIFDPYYCLIDGDTECTYENSCFVRTTNYFQIKIDCKRLPW